MSLPASIRAALITAAIGFAVVAQPALADAPVAVTFQANNPWAQELGSVTRTDSSHDYAVTVGAGKTFQINLITRDPNLYFKVTRADSRKPLIDTYTTGTRTWSTANAPAGNYLIHVYIQPEAIGADDTTKYALQVGQYDQADMQAATTAVTFEAGKPWAEAVGTLDAQGTAHDYTVSIPAGENLAVNLVARDAKVHFKVLDKASGKTLIDNAQSGATQWTTPVAVASEFTVSIYVDPAQMPPGSRVGYAVQIGHYAQAASAPAAAGSAAPPPAASAPASSH